MLETMEDRFNKARSAMIDDLKACLASAGKIPNTPKGIEQLREVVAKALHKLEIVDPSPAICTELTAEQARANGVLVPAEIPDFAVLWCDGWDYQGVLISVDGFGQMDISLLPRNPRWQWVGARVEIDPPTIVKMRFLP